jgi:ABC-type molybdenum transport system ATPase subunit/photorepair protein PhrA
VHVRVAGHTVLAGINLTIDPGSHVAIVGPSGAGKSSLVGTLLGWYRPASGEMRIDDVPLDHQRLAQLRRETAWVDPAVGPSAQCPGATARRAADTARRGGRHDLGRRRTTGAPRAGHAPAWGAAGHP